MREREIKRLHMHKRRNGKKKTTTTQISSTLAQHVTFANLINRKTSNSLIIGKVQTIHKQCIYLSITFWFPQTQAWCNAFIVKESEWSRNIRPSFHPLLIKSVSLYFSCSKSSKVQVKVLNSRSYLKHKSYSTHYAEWPISE